MVPGQGDPSTRLSVPSTLSPGPDPVSGRFLRCLGRSPWVPDALRSRSIRDRPIRALVVPKITEKDHHPLKMFHPSCTIPTGIVKHPDLRQILSGRQVSELSRTTPDGKVKRYTKDYKEPFGPHNTEVQWEMKNLKNHTHQRKKRKEYNVKAQGVKEGKLRHAEDTFRTPPRTRA